MERKKFYDEIYEDIIRSIQEFEDDDISERYDGLYDYFFNHEDIISQYSTIIYCTIIYYFEDSVIRCKFPFPLELRITGAH